MGLLKTKLIIKKLYSLWKKHPQLRLGQILTIITSNTEKELWDVEDEDLLNSIDEELAK